MGIRTRREGRRERWWAGEDETSSIMAARALEAAIAASGDPAVRLDAVIAVAAAAGPPSPKGGAYRP